MIHKRNQIDKESCSWRSKIDILIHPRRLKELRSNLSHPSQPETHRAINVIPCQCTLNYGMILAGQGGRTLYTFLASLP